MHKHERDDSEEFVEVFGIELVRDEILKDVVEFDRRNRREWQIFIGEGGGAIFLMS